MSTHQSIQLAIAGLGRAGMGNHCKELQGKENQFRIAAACDPITERLNTMRERYGCRTYEDLRTLLSDPNIELVDIATRSCDHAAHAIMAMEAGKDVLVEKPLALTYDEAYTIKEAAAKTGQSVYVRHNRRFEDAFLHIREIIAAGILGEVYEVKLARHGYNRRNDWQTIKQYGGGQLLNWGPHIVDHALCFLDSPLQSMWSDLKRVAAAGDAEDHVKIVLKGTNGTIVDMEISGGVAISSPQHIVYGTRGTLIHEGKQLRLKYLDPKQELSSIEANAETPDGGYGNAENLQWIEETIPVGPKQKYDIWNELYEAVREGKPYFISLDRAMEVMKVISEARKGTIFDLS